MSDDLKITTWPSTPEEHRWHRFLEAARQRWGYDFVSATRVYESFDRRVAQDLPGFRALGPGKHCQVISADIAHMVTLQPRKGGMYVVHFGALLTFVPVASGKILRRARLSDRAHPTLWDEPHNEASATGAANMLRRTIDPLTDTDLIHGAHTHHGVGFLELTLGHHWQISLSQVQSWFAANTTVASVLQTARTQIELKSDYATHYPSQQLVAAYAMGRLGLAEEARAALAEWCGLADSAVPPKKWEERLEEVLLEATT